MGEIKFTEKQRKAIDKRKSNILVSAAAGSGKTAVLIERIKELIIKDGVSVSDMLVVTFTDAAASEMKTKLIKKINEEITFSDDERLIKRLKKELDIINSANISTFHGFALDSIRKFYSLIDIEPNLKIIDDAEKEILIEESMNDLIDSYFESNDSDFISFIDKYTNGKNLNDFRSMIYTMYSKILSMENPFLWLDKSLELLNMDIGKFKELNLLKPIIDDEIKKINKYLDLYNFYIDELDEDAPNLHILLDDDIVKIGNFIIALKTYDFDLIKNYEIDWARKAKKVHYKDAKLSDDALDDILDKLRDNGIKKVIKDFKSKYFYDSLENLISDINYTYSSAKFLVSAIHKFNDIFANKKTKKGLMTFSDIEHFSYEILSKEQASTYYKNKFKYIFIDEFQDTNGIQYAIIDKIKNSDNLFMVGDVKQSIYRFREAEPDLFIKKYKEYKEKEEVLKEDSDSIKIDLNGNFRSKRKIVDFVNAIFENILDGYDDNEKLIGSSPNLDDENQDVKMFLINSKGTTDESEIDSTIKDFAQTEREALATCYIIKNYAYKGGFKNSDIAILLRKNNGDIFYNILNQNGIDSYIDDNDGYFDTIEINTFCSLLKVIDNFDRDIDLLTILRSEIFNFSVSELSDIRINAFEEKAYYRALVKYANSGLDESLKVKCKNVLDKLKYYRERSFLLPLDDFIWEVLLDSNFYISCGSLLQGKRRQANLMALVDKARNYRKNYDGGLYNFIKYIERVKKNEVKVGQVKLISEGDNVVRIMTIHKSKGLQFPVVIMPSFSQRLMYRSGDTNLVMNKDIGFSIKYSDFEEHYKKNTILENIIKGSNKKNDIDEEKRILYVALTRAESSLYLISSVKSKEEYDDLKYKVEANDSYLHMAGSSIVRHLNDRVIISDQELSTLNNKKGRETEIILDKLNEEPVECVDEVKRRLTYKYDSSELKSKYSVSELNMKTSYDENTVNIMENTNISHDFTLAEIGTIMHKVLYEVDFNKARMNDNYLDELLSYMKKEEMLTSEEIKVIDKDKILILSKSDLGKRIINSSKVYREQSFTLKRNDDMGEYLVQGIIDLFFYEDDGIVLVDYKTTKKKDEEELRNIYKTQIEIYKEAIEKSKGKPVKEAYLYLTNSGKLIRM